MIKEVGLKAKPAIYLFPDKFSPRKDIGAWDHIS